MSLRFIYVVACVALTFLFKAELYVYTTFYFFLHLSVSGLLGGLHFGAIVKNAVINVSVEIFFETLLSNFGCILPYREVELLNHMDEIFFMVQLCFVKLFNIYFKEANTQGWTIR